MKVMKPDGSVATEKQKCFTALYTAMATGTDASGAKMIFGDSQMTQSLKIYQENWKSFCEMLDQIVKKQIEIYSARDDDAELTCLVDILLDSDVYQN